MPNNHNDYCLEWNKLAEATHYSVNGDVKSYSNSVDKEKSLCRQNIEAVKMRMSEKKKAKYKLCEEVQTSSEKDFLCIIY